MYALDSAHVKCDVWIRVELLPFYSTGSVDDRTARSTQIKKMPNLIDSNVELYMYLMLTLDSAHVKCDVWIRVELLPFYSTGSVE